jgi:hypothetical protein
MAFASTETQERELACEVLVIMGYSMEEATKYNQLGALRLIHSRFKRIRNNSFAVTKQLNEMVDKLDEIAISLPYFAKQQGD